MASYLLKDRKYCKGAIVCDYLCGDTMQTIRNKYGIKSFETVTRALRPCGIKRKPKEKACKPARTRKEIYETSGLAKYNQARREYAQEHGYTHHDHGTSRKYVRWQEVFERDNGMCYLCGQPVDVSDYKTVNGWLVFGDNFPSADHVMPKSRGGSGTADNIRLAHIGCNRKKSDKTTGGLF